MESPYSAVMPVTTRPDVVFAQGEGSWLEDRNGRRYLDFVQGWAVNCLGHSPQVIVEALKHQAEQLLNTGPGFYNTPMLRLAKTLVERSAFDQVFFANSGAEANEGAIKLARKWGALHKQGAYGFVTMENDDEANKAIRKLNDVDFKDRQMVVNEAKPRKQNYDR